MQNPSSGPASKPKGGSSQPSEASLKRKRGFFQKDLQHMMYGFGDDPNPLPETVALVEDIVVEYVTDLICQCCCTGVVDEEQMSGLDEWYNSPKLPCPMKLWQHMFCHVSC
uniref:Transcription initiation factor TFIID subunit 13 n=1 Tax=Anthurium amnicola TaxID=1678845 RepID=A0A1D1XKD5_9ARAE